MKRATKSYKNLNFLNSRQARIIRIIAEYMEPEKRFNDNNIKHTVVFFGSARINPNDKNNLKCIKYYHAAEELAYKLAMWSHELAKTGDTFAICTGGGPGIMEAANKGAKKAKAISIGLNISLPKEQEPNNYITPKLNFEFHYFFMRKLWFLYHAKALIFFPGGYGTLDELFEALTLLQSGKMQKKHMIILLYDQQFWKNIINFDKLLKLKFISAEDIKLFHYFSSVDEGFKILQNSLPEIIKNFHL
jgi:uncharacterized protein (TIGR00730 family)